ncbi:hypothetical protein MNB_SM-3-228 [hydrothermal vent metagenome]|uniref:Uncharacterized protein n=1 Tax=hydrothermal vent metagenome TaxID=652676 RepID=A0A1W1D3M6_9ZZZZ
MKREIYELFQEGSKEKILAYLEEELKVRNESAFWAEKVVPFSSAILSVLQPLEQKGLLFDPQGIAQQTLTPELFLEWNDFLSLKMLAFTLQKSNDAGVLLRTKLPLELCQIYEPIDLDEIGSYLAKYSVNLEREDLDFPIASYNLHQGVSNVIRSLWI